MLNIPLPCHQQIGRRLGGSGCGFKGLDFFGFECGLVIGLFCLFPRFLIVLFEFLFGLFQRIFTIILKLSKFCLKTILISLVILIDRQRALSSIQLGYNFLLLVRLDHFFSFAIRLPNCSPRLGIESDAWNGAFAQGTETGQAILGTKPFDCPLVHF